MLILKTQPTSSWRNIHSSTLSLNKDLSYRTEETSLDCKLLENFQKSDSSFTVSRLSSAPFWRTQQGSYCGNQLTCLIGYTYTSVLVHIRTKPLLWVSESPALTLLFTYQCHLQAQRLDSLWMKLNHGISPKEAPTAPQPLVGIHSVAPGKQSPKVSLWNASEANETTWCWAQESALLPLTAAWTKASEGTRALRNDPPKVSYCWYGPARDCDVPDTQELCTR